MPDTTERRLGFSPRQFAVISSAAVMLAIAAIAVVTIGALRIGLHFVTAHSGVLLPPVAAIILAQVVHPVHDHVRRALWRLVPASARGRSRALRGVVSALSIIIVLLATLLPVVAFLWYFGSLVVQQLAGLVEKAPDAARWAVRRLPDAREYLQAHGFSQVIDRLDPGAWIDAASIAEAVRQRAFAVVGGVPAFVSSVTSWLMVLVYLVIYLCSRPLGGADFTKALFGASDRTRENARFLIDEFLRIVTAFFRGQVLVAVIEGALFGLGFQFLGGLPYGLTLGLLVGFVNIVPYMGSIFVMPAVGLFAYFGAGGLTTLLIVLAVWGAVGLADFYITPAVVGDRTGLGAFAVIFSLLFWGEVIGGFAGLFLAVPLSAFLAVAWRFAEREYGGARKEANAAAAAASAANEEAGTPTPLAPRPKQ